VIYSTSQKKTKVGGMYSIWGHWKCRLENARPENDRPDSV